MARMSRIAQSIVRRAEELGWSPTAAQASAINHTAATEYARRIEGRPAPGREESRRLMDETTDWAIRVVMRRVAPGRRE